MTSTDRNSVHIPDGMNSLIPTKLLVQTGPAYLDTGCTRPGTVEVYLIPSGKFFLDNTQRRLSHYAKALTGPHRVVHSRTIPRY